MVSTNVRSRRPSIRLIHSIIQSFSSSLSVLHLLASPYLLDHSSEHPLCHHLLLHRRRRHHHHHHHHHHHPRPPAGLCRQRRRISSAERSEQAMCPSTPSETKPCPSAQCLSPCRVVPPC